MLVADDDRTIRTVLTQALTRAGCRVHATSSLTTLMRWVAEGKGDAIITDVPEPWEFFTNNKIKNSVCWVSYLPSMTQVMRMNDVLKEHQFQDIEIKEVILRDWVVDEKIVRPSNKLVSHTGFLISAKYIKY